MFESYIQLILSPPFSKNSFQRQMSKNKLKRYTKSNLISWPQSKCWSSWSVAMIPKNLLNKTALKRMAFRKRCESGRFHFGRVAVSYMQDSLKKCANERIFLKSCEFFETNYSLVNNSWFVRSFFFFLSLNSMTTCHAYERSTENNIWHLGKLASYYRTQSYFLNYDTEKW